MEVNPNNFQWCFLYESESFLGFQIVSSYMLLGQDHVSFLLYDFVRQSETTIFGTIFHRIIYERIRTESKIMYEHRRIVQDPMSGLFDLGKQKIHPPVLRLPNSKPPSTSNVHRSSIHSTLDWCLSARERCPNTDILGILTNDPNTPMISHSASTSIQRSEHPAPCIHPTVPNHRWFFGVFIDLIS